MDVGAPKPDSIVRLLGRLAAGVDADALVAALTDDPPSVDDLAAWIRDDHPPDEDYARTLVARGPDFEVLVMTWRAGDTSAIHDHGRAGFGVVRLYGDAQHRAFRVDGDRLTPGPTERLAAGAVLSVPPELVHQLGNPGPGRMVSLHVYVATADERAPTSGMHLFDVAAERVLRTDGGAFRHPPEDAVPVGVIRLRDA